MSIENKIIDAVAKSGPWLAPIPTAWAVGAAAYAALAWPIPVAVAAGVAVEVMNISAIYTALELRSYNQDKRQDDPLAPTWLAIGMGAVTLAASFVLAVLVGIYPEIAMWSAAVFPLLSLAGAVTLALRSDHAARLAAISESKEQERQRREKARREKAERAESLPERIIESPESVPVTPESVAESPEVARRKAAWPDLLPEERRELAGRSGEELLAIFDISDRTARTWASRLKDSHILESGNGKARA